MRAVGREGRQKKKIQIISTVGSAPWSILVDLTNFGLAL